MRRKASAYPVKIEIRVETNIKSPHKIPPARPSLNALIIKPPHYEYIFNKNVPECHPIKYFLIKQLLNSMLASFQHVIKLVLCKESFLTEH